jgi:hypothetical protein
MYMAKYHLSGYGVYHRTTYFEYTAAPCEVGGKGGGDRGLVKNQTTVRWETAAPETVYVQRINGGQPFMARKPGPGFLVPGIGATATVSSQLTNSVENVGCNLDGTEEIHGVPYANKCGSHTYSREYYAGVEWPTAPGESFTVSLQPIGTFASKVGNDWHNCWSAHYQYDDAGFVHGALPFAHLPRTIRGKLTAIAQGHETIIDTKETQNGQGGTVHQYDAYTETNYVTWVRIG